MASGYAGSPGATSSAPAPASTARPSAPNIQSDKNTPPTAIPQMGNTFMSSLGSIGAASGNPFAAAGGVAVGFGIDYLLAAHEERKRQAEAQRQIRYEQMLNTERNARNMFAPEVAQSFDQFWQWRQAKKQQQVDIFWKLRQAKKMAKQGYNERNAQINAGKLQ